MRQPQYDAHWIEQFAQISDGVGDCDRAANVDDIMFPFLSNLYPQTCRKFTTIVQQSDVNEGEWALDLEMPLHFLGDQSTVVGGGSAVRDEVHLLARDCVHSSADRWSAKLAVDTRILVERAYRLIALAANNRMIKIVATIRPSGRSTMLAPSVYANTNVITKK